MRRRGLNQRKKPRLPAILIFGESHDDCAAIAELVAAIRPDLPRPRVMAEPIVLISKEEILKATSSANADRIAKVTAAAQIKSDVIAVVAHRDCDACEPVHEQRAQQIEQALESRGVPKPVAATPAFETEAWWLLWPKALAATRGCWTRLSTSKNVGAIEDAKEHLTRVLRPRKAADRARCRDYEESDSVDIARYVRTMGLIEQHGGVSASFNRFKDRVSSI